MDLGLRGRVAVVCAASQGLGKAAAMGFAREGAHVVICSRDRRRLLSAAREIQSSCGDKSVRVVPVVADLTKAGHISRLIATVLKEFRRLDVLVTNAGGPPVARFPDLDDKLWQKGVELTLMSTVRCIRAALPQMQKQKWGRIVAITSIAAKQPLDDIIVSSTLRPGILGLAKVLSNQYAKDGVLVNCVTPGFILTARQKEISAARAAKDRISVEDYVRDAARAIPLGRYGEPEELANVIVFLGSDRASYVTGATIAVDGGLARGLF